MVKGVKKVGTEKRRERGGKSNIKDLAQTFYEELSVAGTNNRNIHGIRYRVRKLIEYLEENYMEVTDLSIKAAQDYQGWITLKGTGKGNQYTPGSIRNFMKAAKRFYEFLKRKGVVATNPFKEVLLIRGEKKLPKNILKEKEMNKLLKALSRFTDAEGNIKREERRYKVHIICEVMYATGLRISEIASLQVSDIDLEKREIHLRRGKGGEQGRVVFLNEYATHILSFYIREIYPLFKKKMYYNHTSSLFGATGNRLLTFVNEDLKEVCNKLDVRNVTCHGFRHAVGFHLLRAGCDIRYIQELLGHKQIKNTEIYTKVERDDLREKIDQYHPRQFWRIKGEETE
jgi:site-specific recombinase XerD